VRSPAGAPVDDEPAGSARVPASSAVADSSAETACVVAGSAVAEPVCAAPGWTATDFAAAARPAASHFSRRADTFAINPPGSTPRPTIHWVTADKADTTAMAAAATAEGVKRAVATYCPWLAPGRMNLPLPLTQLRNWPTWPP
jgi:hypothetical protein